jgi:pimeloyl-ACP methyl ester carboxylesterase
VMHGDRDPVLPPVFFEGHERYADDMTIESVKRAGHLLPEEAPEIVSERALEFFGAKTPTEAAAA